MKNNNNDIVKYGVCADNSDPYGAGRIRVIFDTELVAMVANETNVRKVLNKIDVQAAKNGGPRTYIPWENSVSRDADPHVIEPFLPKHINVIPKVGESVKVIIYRTDTSSAQQEYIGPHTSTLDKLNFDDYTSGRRFTRDSHGYPSKENIRTDGYIMDINDLGINGRNNSDMILADRSIFLRSGHQNQQDKTKNGEHALMQLQTFLNKKRLKTTTSVTDQTSTAIIANVVEYKLDRTESQFTLDLNVYPTADRLNNKNYDSSVEYLENERDVILELSTSANTIDQLITFMYGLLNDLDENRINLNFDQVQTYQGVQYKLTDYRTEINGVIVNNSQTVNLGLYAFRPKPTQLFNDPEFDQFHSVVKPDIRPIHRIPKPVRITKESKTLENVDSTGEHIGIVGVDKMFMLSWLNDKALAGIVGKYGFSQETIHTYLQENTQPMVRGGILVDVLISIIDILLDHGHSKTGPSTINEDAKQKLANLRDELAVETNENLEGGPQILNPKLRLN